MLFCTHILHVLALVLIFPQFPPHLPVIFPQLIYPSPINQCSYLIGAVLNTHAIRILTYVSSCSDAGVTLLVFKDKIHGLLGSWMFYYERWCLVQALLDLPRLRTSKIKVGGGILIIISVWISHNLNYFHFIISISGQANLSFWFAIFRSVLAILENFAFSIIHYLFQINFSGFTNNSVGLWSHIKSQGHLVKISISKHLGSDVISFQQHLKNQSQYHGISWQIVNSNCLAVIFLSWNNVLRLRTSVFLITSWS